MYDVYRIEKHSQFGDVNFKVTKVGAEEPLFKGTYNQCKDYIQFLRDTE